MHIRCGLDVCALAPAVQAVSAKGAEGVAAYTAFQPLYMPVQSLRKKYVSTCKVCERQYTDCQCAIIAWGGAAPGERARRGEGVHCTASNALSIQDDDGTE